MTKNMKSLMVAVVLVVASMAFAACMGTKSNAMANGSELVGVRGASAGETAPFGMVAVNRGSLKIGLEENDTLWGSAFPRRDISVDGFWMDQYEVSNAKYRQFVYWVRDSIIRERLADPAYGGDETYKIEEDRYGEPVAPHLNWNKPIPSERRATEDELRAIESVYITHPIDGTRMLDASQMNYRYEIYDYAMAAKRKYRLDPRQRDLNTDNQVDENEVVMISKDTAWIDDDGKIVRQTITRPLSGPWDFLNTYIVNVYPDTTCWVNDFDNADNERYMKLYFSHSAYDDYPVVGVDWEQANAFCAWRTDMMNVGMGAYAKHLQRYRLPSEVEWEYAARGGTSTPYFFEGSPSDYTNEGFWNGIFGADTTQINRYVIYVNNSKNRSQEPSKVLANPFGLKNMLGNVMEYCSDWYAEDAYSQLADGAKDPKGPDSGTEYVVRGGTYASDASELRSAARSYTRHDDWLRTDPQNPKSIWWYSDIKSIGFRVVCEVPEEIKNK